MPTSFRLFPLGTLRINSLSTNSSSGYLTGSVRPGAVLDVAAPRGDFVLDHGTGPVLLISAGIGVTPVLSMLHELAAAGSDREVWWIHGDRGPREQALAAEAHDLLASLPHAHEQVFWSSATAAERARGHAGPAASRGRAGRTRCPGRRGRLRLRPGLVHDRHPAGPHRDRHRAGPHPHRAVRGAAADQPRRDRPGRPAAAPAAGTGRNRAAGHLRPQRHLHPVHRRPGAACSNSPTPATCRAAGAAGPGSATPASRPCSPATSPTRRTRWNRRPTTRCSSAAPGPTPTSSSTCDEAGAALWMSRYPGSPCEHDPENQGVRRARPEGNRWIVAQQPDTSAGRPSPCVPTSFPVASSPTTRSRTTPASSARSASCRAATR